MGRDLDDIHVLLVSANQSNIRIVNKALMDTVYTTCRISHCETMQEALAHLVEHETQTDIAIFDLGLIPTTDPALIYREIESVPPCIPVIIYTKSGVDEHKLAADSIQANTPLEIITGRFGRIPEAIKFSLMQQQRQTGNCRIISWVTGDHAA